eukprot:g36105.t1
MTPSTTTTTAAATTTTTTSSGGGSGGCSGSVLPAWAGCAASPSCCPLGYLCNNNSWRQCVRDESLKWWVSCLNQPANFCGVLTCYRQNTAYAQCRDSCPSDWLCASTATTTTSTTTTAAPTTTAATTTTTTTTTTTRAPTTTTTTTTPAPPPTTTTTTTTAAPTTAATTSSAISTTQSGAGCTGTVLPAWSGCVASPSCCPLGYLCNNASWRQCVRNEALNWWASCLTQPAVCGVLKCYKQNAGYAQCRDDCPSDWDCTILH